MALNFGRPQLSIPGPSIIPDRVLSAMHQPSPNIYEGELIDMSETIFPDLQKVARTKGSPLIYISNGHGAWEAAIANCFSKGDKVLVLGTGVFGKGWAALARSMGLDVEILDFGPCNAADPLVVAGRLKQDTAFDIQAVLTVQTDTASSVQNDISGLRRAIDDSGHPALFMVDCIASLGCEQFEMDEWGVDVMVSGSQKGLMVPAGLGFVFFTARAALARKSANLVSQYWDWEPRAHPKRFYERFAGTPPTQHLFGLRTALDMLVNEEGIENAWARHETFARAVWTAVDVWGPEALRPNIANPCERSHAVTTLISDADNAARLRNWCQEKAGLTLGVGLGLEEDGWPPAHSMLRVGHMGHLNVPMILGTIGTMDAGLKALGIPHGNGAIEAAARVISQHDF
jgi:alanine-glyoxylate transaminase/serine-glyoxylate transaminase/serine-pyruvate transaminase